MDVTWSDEDVIDADGRLTAAAEALLPPATHDERVAVITVLGARATASARRRLVAELLDQPEPDQSQSSKSGVSLVASASYLEEDYRLLVLDVGDASSPVIGALCMLSSLVLSACDTPAAVSSALPAFPPFHDAMEQLARDASPAELYDTLPYMVTVDFSREGRLEDATATVAATKAGEYARLKTLPIRSPPTLLDESNPPLLQRYAQVKKICGSELTIESLLSLLRSFEHDATTGQTPDLSSAWDEFVERKCRTIAEEASATYDDCVRSSLAQDADPIESEVLEKLQADLSRLALDLFDSGTACFATARKRSVRTQLKTDLAQRREREKTLLIKQSEAFCQQLRTQLWEELSAPLFTTDTDNGTLYQATLAAVREFDAGYMARARGPAKLPVLREFHRDEAITVFERLEQLARQSLTEAHLGELRRQLEREFDDKKRALVERFQQEQAQLQVAAAQEREMMAKLQLAKASRAKMDEGEARRLREEAAELRTANASLVASQVALEHAVEDATQRSNTLEGKARDLEDALRQERASRGELVDTLAATIKASEEKEAALTDRIATLEVEVGEKTARIEHELLELRLQLRKTSEEKEELQRKLNEFFLRVTALPPALQQHLFCVDTDQPVGFADALSSYCNT